MKKIFNREMDNTTKHLRHLIASGQIYLPINFKTNINIKTKKYCIETHLAIQIGTREIYSIED